MQSGHYYIGVTKGREIQDVTKMVKIKLPLRKKGMLSPNIYIIYTEKYIVMDWAIYNSGELGESVCRKILRIF